ncbi:hypothetical protein M8J75_006342 [Diaphorina citri]|nr:hypothetical protein M8J75_006342 [Diaphorina citri]
MICKKIAEERYKLLQDQNGAILTTFKKDNVVKQKEFFDSGLCLRVCKKPVKVHFVDGNHFTVLDNIKSAQIIMHEDSTDFKTALFTSDDTGLNGTLS